MKTDRKQTWLRLSWRTIGADAGRPADRKASVEKHEPGHGGRIDQCLGINRLLDQEAGNGKRHKRSAEVATATPWRHLRAPNRRSTKRTQNTCSSRTDMQTPTTTRREPSSACRQGNHDGPRDHLPAGHVARELPRNRVSDGGHWRRRQAAAHRPIRTGRRLAAGHRG
jgi:hypothetical protein